VTLPDDGTLERINAAAERLGLSRAAYILRWLPETAALEASRETTTGQKDLYRRRRADQEAKRKRQAAREAASARAAELDLDPAGAPAQAA
jgi:hypothetical protein